MTCLKTLDSGLWKKRSGLESQAAYESTTYPDYRLWPAAVCVQVGFDWTSFNA
jgi:hypothetical protein